MDTTLTPPPRPAGRRRSAGHIVAIVIGCLMLLPAVGLLAGGGAIIVGQAVATDDDGYFRFTLDRVESDGVAVATTDVWFDDVQNDGPWVLDWLDVDLRLRVSGAGPTDEVFVGIARTPDVERYLAGAAWSELIDVDGITPEYRQVAGAASVDPPLDSDFWAVTGAGSGEQEITWNARGGRWSVVVMNADGSSDVEADVEVGARSGALTPIAIVLLTVGTVSLAFAVSLIVFGSRGRRTPPVELSGADPFVPLAPTPEPPRAADSTVGVPLPPPSRDPAGDRAGDVDGHGHGHRAGDGDRDGDGDGDVDAEAAHEVDADREWASLG